MMGRGASLPEGPNFETCGVLSLSAPKNVMLQCSIPCRGPPCPGSDLALDNLR